VVTDYRGGKNKAIILDHCNHFNPTGVIFRRVPNNCIHTWACSDIHVTESIFRAVGGHCFQVGSDDDLYPASGIVEDCIFENCGVNGGESSFAFVNMGNLEFRRNTSSNSYFNSNGSFFGISAVGSVDHPDRLDVMVEDNLIEGCTGHAVSIFGGSVESQSVGR